EETAPLDTLGKVAEIVLMSALAQGETTSIPIAWDRPAHSEPPPPKHLPLSPLLQRADLLSKFATYILSRAESCTSGDDKTALYLSSLFEALGVKRMALKDATALIREALPRNAAYCVEILLTGQPWDATLGEMGITEPPAPTPESKPGPAASEDEESNE
ncbi:MAG: hypothetical protein Q8O76_08955, partial [Chloroflexota bacterium]|nr:hypothetical protein [Chloroflexota bacterium]